MFKALAKIFTLNKPLRRNTGGEQASESTAAALTVGFIHWPLPYTRDSLLLYK
jgi:hypothetical protein